MDAQKSLWREYLEALLIAVIFAAFARTFLVQAFKIPSGSMEESLLIGDHILVNKFVYGAASPLERALLPQREIERGDVVVFKYPWEPSRDFIKRCVGLPGDNLEISDKVLFLNGQPVADGSYARHFDDRVIRSDLVPEGFRGRDHYGPVEVPAGHYFCLGDNRDHSHDSRVWGPLPADHVKGRALLIYWSRAAETTLEPAGDGRLRQLAHNARRMLRDTRWERTFKVVR